MAGYGLPTRGQANWDDEANNSFEYLNAEMQASRSVANAAHSKANAAYEKATAFFPALTEDPIDPGVFNISNPVLIREDPFDLGTFLIGA